MRTILFQRNRLMLPATGWTARLGWWQIVALIGLTTTTMAAAPAQPAISSTDPAFQHAVEQTIDRYLTAHPEVVERALKTLEAKRQAEERDRSTAAVSDRQEDLLHDPASPVSGNPVGTVTVVEFFDYRCRYCKQVAGAVTQLQQDIPNVRIVYKDFPILGEASELASRAALASRKQGRHQAFHEALLATPAELTQDEVLRIARHVGLDATQLLTDMASPEWTLAIDRTRNLATALGIAGTPAFVVGTDVHRGALDLMALKSLVTGPAAPQTPPTRRPQ